MVNGGGQHHSPPAKEGLGVVAHGPQTHIADRGVVLEEDADRMRAASWSAARDRIERAIPYRNTTTFWLLTAVPEGVITWYTPASQLCAGIRCVPSESKAL